MTVALVTGVTGQDGGYLLERLLDEGVEVHGLTRTTPTAVPGGPGLHLHTGDLADTAFLRALVRDVAPDEVYNLAGISSVAQSWEEPDRTGLLSGVAVTALLDAALRLQEARGSRIAVVQASSAEIFGDPDLSPQDERTPVRPTNPYGAAKAYAHHVCAIYRARGLGVSGCILFNHESPRRPARFVTRKITQGVARIHHEGAGTIALGNLDARRDWGWAPDYVDAMVRAARHGAADDYVVATGVTHSVAEFAAAAFAAVGIDDWRLHVETDPRFVRPTDAAELAGDATRAREVLGWRTTMTFEGMVQAMVEHDVALLDDRPGEAEPVV